MQCKYKIKTITRPWSCKRNQRYYITKSVRSRKSRRDEEDEVIEINGFEDAEWGSGEEKAGSHGCNLSQYIG